MLEPAKSPVLMLPSLPDFGIIVLTAANEMQARSYQKQLDWRQKNGLLPDDTQCLVIADPGGRRVGSGTSTLNVLVELLWRQVQSGQGKRPWADCLRGQRILIAHSGGDARRLPSYAAQGKIFLPLPCDVPIQIGPAWRRFPASLFDLLVRRLSLLPCPAEGQIIICSGDVLLTFDAAQADVATEDGICGLGFAAAPRIAQHHGVYLTPNPSVGGTVTGFLQKPSFEEMTKRNAIDASGRVLVDSGVFCLSHTAAIGLLEAAGVNCSNNQVQIGRGLYEDALDKKVKLIDFYQEIALALPRSTTKEKYLNALERSGHTEEAMDSLGRFFDKLQSAALPFEVAAVPDGEFFHIGTSRDLLTKFTEPSRTARSLKFHNGWRSAPAVQETMRHLENKCGQEPVFFNVQGAVERLEAAGPVYVEQCDFPASFTGLTLHGENIITGWGEDYPTLLKELPKGIGLCLLPIRTQPSDISSQEKESTAPGDIKDIVKVPVLFGIDDDNKKSLGSGQCLFLNQNIQQLLDAGISPEMLWPDGGEQSTWTARLWLLEESGHTLPYLMTVAGATKATSEETQQAATTLEQLWQNQERLCWADLVLRTDTSVLLEQQQRLATRFECQRLFDDLLQNGDFPVKEAIRRLSEFTDVHSALELLQKIQAWHDERESIRQSRRETPNASDFSESLLQARLLSSAALIAEFIETNRATADNEHNQEQIEEHNQEHIADTAAPTVVKPWFGSAHYHSIALHAVAQAVESSVVLTHQPRPAAIQEDQVVWATAPARIDFAGGWSDTPPICFERGGLVLNAAVTINRQYPVQIIAKLNGEKCIRLTSIDLGKQEVYYEAEGINGPPDLSSWSSLAKASLVLSGIVPDAHYPGQEKQSLAQWLDVLGGGLDLTLFSGLPKGSGMGTSSILGAATLACLASVQGQELTHAELISQTSLLEQRMTSGGGWQDQIGGIVAGVKLIRTEPGVSQIPSLQWSVFGGPTHVERFASGLEGASDLLSRRMLLYFTGQKRLAKNILQNVVRRYLNREPELLRIVDELKQGAQEAKWALEANDTVAFAHQVSRYWELKKAIDPGSTNADVEAILERVRPLTSGYSLCGAGGGGFMLLIARDEQAADAIRHDLQSNPPNPHARFFHFAIDNQGLAVTTL